MENNTPYKVVGIGIDRMQSHNRAVRTLSNIWHIPDIKKNLISLVLLMLKGTSVLVKVEL